MNPILAIVYCLGIAAMIVTGIVMVDARVEQDAWRKRQGRKRQGRK